jgi:hypothetical protein
MWGGGVALGGVVVAGFEGDFVQLAQLGGGVVGLGVDFDPHIHGLVYDEAVAARVFSGASCEAPRWAMISTAGREGARIVRMSRMVIFISYPCCAVSRSRVSLP